MANAAMGDPEALLNCSLDELIKMQRSKQEPRQKQAASGAKTRKAAPPAAIKNKAKDKLGVVGGKASVATRARGKGVRAGKRTVKVANSTGAAFRKVLPPVRKAAAGARRQGVQAKGSARVNRIKVIVPNDARQRVSQMQQAPAQQFGGTRAFAPRPRLPAEITGLGSRLQGEYTARNQAGTGGRPAFKGLANQANAPSVLGAQNYNVHFDPYRGDDMNYIGRDAGRRSSNYDRMQQQQEQPPLQRVVSRGAGQRGRRGGRGAGRGRVKNGVRFPC